MSLRVDDLHIRFGETRLIRGASLHVRAGQRVAVTGPSGAGKSTVLRAVAGLIPARSTLRWCDESPATLGWPRWRRRVHYFAQRPSVLAGPARRTLEAPFAYGSAADDGFDQHRARELVASLGLRADLLDAPTSHLSGGELQRLCLVRSLLLRPDVLLLDEPTASLDVASTHAFEQAVVDSLPDAAVLFVTHDPQQVRRFAHREVALRDGLLHDVEAPAARAMSEVE